MTLLGGGGSKIAKFIKKEPKISKTKEISINIGEKELITKRKIGKFIK